MSSSGCRTLFTDVKSARAFYPPRTIKSKSSLMLLVPKGRFVILLIPHFFQHISRSFLPQAVHGSFSYFSPSNLVLKERFSRAGNWALPFSASRSLFKPEFAGTLKNRFWSCWVVYCFIHNRELLDSRTRTTPVRVRDFIEQHWARANQRHFGGKPWYRRHFSTRFYKNVVEAKQVKNTVVVLPFFDLQKGSVTGNKNNWAIYTANKK